MGLLMDTDFYFETLITYTLKQIIIWYKKELAAMKDLLELRANSFSNSFINVWRTPVFRRMLIS